MVLAGASLGLSLPAHVGDELNVSSFVEALLSFERGSSEVGEGESLGVDDGGRGGFRLGPEAFFAPPGKADSGPSRVASCANCSDIGSIPSPVV